MNPVEIEEAVSSLALEPFDRVEFPFQFLRAFGQKDTALARLRAGNTNQTDVPGAILQRGNIHIAACDPGAVDETLKALRESPKTTSQKAKFILATDGEAFQAEDMNGGGTVVCTYAAFPDHFGFFLPLAGITTVEQIRESSFDIKATGRLNKLYVELLKDNPDWASRSADMNHFMARLIFCFFAEDTDIFLGEGLFSKTIEQMSARDSSDTHSVMAEIFRAMDTKPEVREAAGVKSYARKFPYVNGQLFSGSTECPHFSKIARSYLLHIGSLNWKKINPDIFGSMIQAVADDEERGALGMHYTSVPNILKVLNPLFLDDLREKLDEAGDNGRKLLNLRNRMAKIRVFDPACGSGNFLVIAYKEMRELEAEINRRRGEPDRRSDIPLTNFRGIELRNFPAEIARLALIIAEYQCDVLHRGQQEALAEFLPLDSQNWITCGNALRLDWLSICPPTGTGVKVQANDLFETPLDQAEIEFENEGGETYICGNPPYLGSKWQSDEQKADLGRIFEGRIKNWKSLDYVAGWFMKAADYGLHTPTVSAFVSTNSICQGQQVPIFWPAIFKTDHEIVFAHTNFKWANLASHNAGVTVVIVGISRDFSRTRHLIDVSSDGEVVRREAENINAYLVPAPNIEVAAKSSPSTSISKMQFGNHPYYGAPLIFSKDEARSMIASNPRCASYIQPFYGSKEFIDAAPRSCLWIEDHQVLDALSIPEIKQRLDAVAAARKAAANDKTAQKLASTPWRFREQVSAKDFVIVVPRVSSENRPYLPIGVLEAGNVVQEKAFALYDAPLRRPGPHPSHPRMPRRVKIALVLAAPLVLFAVLVGVDRLFAAPPRDGGTSVRITLPQTHGEIGLPPVLGPPDASRPLLVIDPGHGGHDPGAGQGAVREKDLTLALARALRDELLKRGGIRVALTRDDDRYLLLPERSGIARRLGADLFVSIHADSGDNQEASGATFYTLSERGSNQIAARMAERENRADIVNGVMLADQSDQVSAILVDLSQRETQARSEQFAGLLRREAQGRIKLRDEPLQSAAFVVLKSPDLPSVLIEAGYISNTGDSAWMLSDEGRKAFAGAAAKAIRAYFARQSR